MLIFKKQEGCRNVCKIQYITNFNTVVYINFYVYTVTQIHMPKKSTNRNYL